MRLGKTGTLFFLVLMLYSSCRQNLQNQVKFAADGMLIRIAEIEIDPNYLDEYLAILKEESAASVKLESGVIAIFPMIQKERPTEIRILEIYADQEAYEAHLQTPHFMHYKAATSHMVKSLKLMDMNALDTQTMPEIFKKLAE